MAVPSSNPPPLFPRLTRRSESRNHSRGQKIPRFTADSGRSDSVRRTARPARPGAVAAKPRPPTSGSSRSVCPSVFKSAVASAPAVQVRYRWPEAALTLAAMPERTDSFAARHRRVSRPLARRRDAAQPLQPGGSLRAGPQFGVGFDPQLRPSSPTRSDKHHGVDSDQSDVHLPADPK
jgi:hypothetical protein